VKSLAARVERERLGVVGLTASAALHAMVVLAVLLARSEPPRRTLPAYRVELVAAPRAAGPEAGAAPAAAPRPQPAPTPPPRRTTPERRPAPAPRPAPRAATPSAPAHAAASPGRAAAAAAAAPSPTPVAGGAEGVPGGVGADPATIRTEGVEFPFPGYLRNLVAQVYRRWRPPAGNADLEAEVLFLVHRDGSVSGLQFVHRSGAFAFDLEAQGAIEAAARAGAFGELPPGYGADVLPVSFFFSPRSLR
jgi:periplasmic protein TonB